MSVGRLLAVCRYGVFAACVAVVVGIGCGDNGGSATRGGKCSGQGRMVVARGPVAFVYRASNGGYYGCLRASGRSRALSMPVGTVTTVRLRGPYVATVTHTVDVGGTVDELDVTDLRPGGFSAEPEARDNVRGGTAFPAVVLSGRGSVAFIERTPTPEVSICERRRCLDDGATPRHVDSGDAISPTFLHLRGGRLIWRKGRTERSAPFK